MWKEVQSITPFEETIQLLTVWKEVQSITAFEDTWKNSYWWKTFQLFKLCKLSDSSAWKRHERIHTEDKPFSSSKCDKKFSESCSLKNMKESTIMRSISIRNGRQEIWRSMINSILKIDTRKTIYGRVVFKVTHIAFDKMEIIKTTEIHNLLYWILTDVLFDQIYSSKV